MPLVFCKSTSSLSCLNIKFNHNTGSSTNHHLFCTYSCVIICPLVLLHVNHLFCLACDVQYIVYHSLTVFIQDSGIALLLCLLCNHHLFIFVHVHCQCVTINFPRACLQAQGLCLKKTMFRTNSRSRPREDAIVLPTSLNSGGSLLP